MLFLLSSQTQFTFEAKEQIQLHTDERMHDYNNNHHPNESLGDKPTTEFAQAVNQGMPRLTA
jgi:hypothetical protein